MSKRELEPNGGDGLLTILVVVIIVAFVTL